MRPAVLRRARAVAHSPLFWLSLAMLYLVLSTLFYDRLPRWMVPIWGF